MFVEISPDPKCYQIYKRQIIIGICIAIACILIIVIPTVIVTKKKKSKGQEKNQDESQNQNNSDQNTNPDETRASLCGYENGKIKRNCYGGWFYKAYKYPADKLAQYAKQLGWEYAFLSLSSSESKLAQTIQLCKLFSENGIHVHWMTLEDYDTYLVDENGVQHATTQISKVMKIINDNSLPVSGIHIDTEPHGCEAWKNCGEDYNCRNPIFQQYIKVIEESQKIISQRPKTLFSAAVAWWYPQKSKEGLLQNGRGYDLVQNGRLDLVVPMIYDGAGGTIQKVVKRMQDYLGDNVPTVAGMDVQDYNSEFTDAWMGVTNELISNSSFYGVSIYSQERYPEWETFISNF